ncbi:hypothetical protein BU14_0113s0032 [Porphyra umbilicalis]|uniref:Uncharacterized protein n=1 Tax=Porphyra umbilicalis TaxID=2786 RepID=A0A1X6PBN7_PORUM|nr:hypothetical protein BU14_0113s0032 [Porphyra umbilicalis]|eukprot:OSX78288.1 hypothetical protein BU14_0113s0032 [Porphyra umbilicalis]
MSGVPSSCAAAADKRPVVGRAPPQPIRVGGGVRAADVVGVARTSGCAAACGRRAGTRPRGSGGGTAPLAPCTRSWSAVSVDKTASLLRTPSAMDGVTVLALARGGRVEVTAWRLYGWGEHEAAVPAARPTGDSSISVDGGARGARSVRLASAPQRVGSGARRGGRPDRGRDAAAIADAPVPPSACGVHPTVFFVMQALRRRPARRRAVPKPQVGRRR